MTRSGTFSVRLVGLLAVLLAPAASGGDQAPPLRFGMSTCLSGPSSDLGIAMRLGVLAEFARVNAAGGIAGRTLELIALDDGYEPRRATPNMRILVEDEDVLAVIGNVGTPTAVVAAPIAVRAKTLFFAPFTGAAILRPTPAERYIAHFRASYAQETSAMIDALLATGRIEVEDIVFFTQRDAFGDAGYDGAISALAKYVPDPAARTLHLRYERNTLIVEQAVARLLLRERPPKAVIQVGTYGPCAKFIALARDAGMDPLFLNVSFVGSRSLADALKDDDAKVVVTQVVPHPEDSRLAAVSEYLAAIRGVDPDARPDFVSLEGFLAARILVRALERAAPRIDRESVIDALDGLSTFDLGIGEPMSLGRRDRQASDRIWPTRLVRGELVAFDWADLAPLLESRSDAEAADRR